MRSAVISLTLLAAGVLVFASEPPPMTIEEAQANQLLLFATRPSYPYQAERAHVSGFGVFDLKFDYETGHLREIHVVKSTGYDFLDGHAIGALKLWKAKSRSIHTLRVPVGFQYKPRLLPGT
jgi:outer membrane biosynthesis protein TonB